MHNIHTIEAVDSTAVYKIQWDSETKNMTVTYRQGKSYVHPDISYDAYARLEDTIHSLESVGTALARWKQKYGKTVKSVDDELVQLLEALDPDTKKVFAQFARAAWQARNAT